jgi:hypothetical protein
MLLPPAMPAMHNHPAIFPAERICRRPHFFDMFFR